ncbi:hypothetical protein GCM10012285_03790 [Streptomyces kronopolitis]|uniref:DUF4333 domain-containing protein n=1 Tax=Streptomyces kronopolitis TaxID=1612435 RepID=A0ABQ2IZS9_9ACTN|nr:DUF4333 domain-containing protein [Streptomyces kronopolitis]GGN33029.1 hypothetical protein GCM10012285_03790 [Streptomyces kronopolitis]
MKYLAVSLATVGAVAVAGLAFVAVPRLLSTESTSTMGPAATVSRTEVEKQVRDNYAVPPVQKKPKAVSCVGGLRPYKEDTVECTVTPQDGKTQHIAVSVTKVDGSKVSYDYAVLAE